MFGDHVKKYTTSKAIFKLPPQFTQPRRYTKNTSEHSELRDVIIKSNASGIALDQQKVDQYIKAMSLNGNEKVNTEKLAAMWMYATQMGSLPPPTVRKLTPPSRQIMLIPSTAGSGMAPPPPTRLPPPPPGAGAGLLLPVPPQYRGMTLPYMRPGPGSVLYAHPASLSGTYRTHKSTKSAEINGQRRRRRAGKSDANRRQRRKSEADVLDGAPNFQYTGLDRAIADSFLARQEQSQAGSHIDYSSSASSDLYGNKRASSKTKIVCRDVVM